MWQLAQLTKLSEKEPETIECALKDMLETHKDLFYRVIVGAYLDRQINLSKAAEILGIHPLEIRKQFQKQGVPIRIGLSNKDEAVAEVKAFRAWKE
ncbi:MAG: UPF0175 family protein [bacterium]|nr:UPF0175 family protein [bacterium]